MGRPLGRDERRGALDGSEVGLGEVGGAAPQLGEFSGERVDHLAGCRTRGDVLAGLERGQRVGDVRGQFVRLDTVEQRLALGIRGSPGVERLLPCCAFLGGAVGQGTGVRDDLVVDDEALLGVEAEHLLGGGELFGAERRAVDLAGVLLTGRRPADDGLEDDQRRLGGLALGGLDGRVQLGDVFDVLTGLLPVDRLHVPAIGLVAGGDVLSERDVRIVFDGDLVRVVDGDQIAQLLVAGQRPGLAGDALLQVAVARDHVDEVVERARARGSIRIEQAALVAGGVREADGR